MLPGADRPPAGPLDAAFICPETTDEAIYFAGKMPGRLADGAVWIITPNAPRPGSLELVYAMHAQRYEPGTTTSVDDGLVAFGFRLAARGPA